jgi:hypothetical protein
MKLKPLHQFICDECGQLIEKVEDGWLEWLKPPEKPVHGFRIVHVAGASPRFHQGGNCYYPESYRASDNHLNYFAGPDGLALLLSFTEWYLGDPKELAEIIRRTHVPHYEEARQYLDKAYGDGFISSSRDYSQEDLKKVIEEYGKD